MKSIRLSQDFRLSELVKSDTAIRLNIDNTPSEEVIEKLRLLALNVLQPIRDYLKRPLLVNSGYRCPELNELIGSSPRSQHLLGEAADVESMYVSNYELACWIRDNLIFDQLILECYTPGDPNSGWVHVSYKSSGNRNECLTIFKGGGIRRGIHSN